jgi:hypothetical protein
LRRYRDSIRFSRLSFFVRRFSHPSNAPRLSQSAVAWRQKYDPMALQTDMSQTPKT